MRTRSILALCGISLLWGSEWTVRPLLDAIAKPIAGNALILLASAAVLLLASRLWPAEVAPEKPIAWRSTVFLALLLLGVPTLVQLLAGLHGALGWLLLLPALLPLLLSFREGASSAAMPVAFCAAASLLRFTLPIRLANLPWLYAVLFATGAQAFALRYVATELRGAAGRSMLRSLAVQCGLAAALLGAASVFAEAGPRLLFPGQPAAWLALLVIATLGTAAGYAVLVFLLARSSLAPWQVAVAQWLQILVFFTEGLVFGRPPWLFVVSAVVLAGCCWRVLAVDHDAGPATLSIRPS